MKPEKEIIVGGQAVLEGVMMRTPNAYAIAVRRQDGTLVTKSDVLPKLSEKYPWLKIPVLRGGAVLIHSMMLGVKALNFSANVMMEEEEAKQRAGLVTSLTHTLRLALMSFFQLLNFSVEEESARAEAQSDSTADAASGSGQNQLAMAGSLVFALGFQICLFVVLPLLITNALFIYFGWTNAPALSATATDGAWYQVAWHTAQAYLKPVRPSIEFNLVDGMIRMVFFLIMIYSFSKMRDIRRVFEYHGAEHKTVFAWEAAEELIVSNAKRHQRQHPRCGTSFLMLVVLVSIILFSIVKFDSLLMNLLIRIALMPVVAGISYEIIRAAGRKEASAFFAFITRPGMWLQNLTTQEPDDQQLETAIVALQESLKLEPAGGSSR